MKKRQIFYTVLLNTINYLFNVREKRFETRLNIILQNKNYFEINLKLFAQGQIRDILQGISFPEV